MRIRAQLVLSFFLLAVVPLSAIVGYSYFSSLRAVRNALSQETASLSKEMTQRMASIKDDLDHRVERVAGLPVGDLVEASRHESSAIPRAMIADIGDVAPLVSSVEFAPVPEPPALPDVEIHAPGSVHDKTIVITEAHKPSEVVPPAPPSTVGTNRAVEAPTPPTAPTPEALRVEIERARKQIRIANEVAQKNAAAMRRIADKATKESMARDREMKLLLGRSFEVPVMRDGVVVGTVKAQIAGRQVLQRVFESTRADEGEIPFAVDTAGNVYTRADGDKPLLASLGATRFAPDHVGTAGRGNWIVATSKDNDSGLKFGIARPVKQPLDEIRRTAARNFSYGLILIALALLGIVPIANHMTRDVTLVTDGANRIAAGDLSVVLPVKSKNEFGQLANAFNRMARDLGSQQTQIVEQERLRQEQELQQRLLAAEFSRKSDELEEARRFQLSLLPKSIPTHDAFEIAVSMKTATEVGGDYYDFRSDGNGAMTAVVGDATGHGAKAGTMVTVVKALFSAYSSQIGPSEFLNEAAGAIRRMDLARMSMGLLAAKLERGAVTFSAAGMPPVLLHRCGDGSIEELAFEAPPLGTLQCTYGERSVELRAGDTLLLMSDGLPELQNESGEPLGYAAVEAHFRENAHLDPDALVASFSSLAERWCGAAGLSDDMTLVLIRARE